MLIVVCRCCCCRCCLRRRCCYFWSSKWCTVQIGNSGGGGGGGDSSGGDDDNDVLAMTSDPTTTVSLSLDGVQQDLTVSEHQTLTFQCQESDGDPAPTVSLLRLDNSTELSTGQSSLSHSAVVNCQDSGTYVCTADNGLGPEATSVARNLFVQCKMG